MVISPKNEKANRGREPEVPRVYVLVFVANATCCRGPKMLTLGKEKINDEKSIKRDIPGDKDFCDDEEE